MDADDVIGNYKGWLYKAAGQISSPSSPHLEDLVQEGRLAMWLALESHDPSKGALPAWLTSKARFRMLTVARTKLWTGQPPRHHGRNPADEPEALSLDAERQDGCTLADLIPDDINYTERAELACHRAEVRAARLKLTPAQQIYVAARFDLQLSQKEMVDASVFPYDPSALWNSKRNGAQKKLAHDLEHLRGMT